MIAARHAVAGLCDAAAPGRIPVLFSGPRRPECGGALVCRDFVLQSTFKEMRDSDGEMGRLRKRKVY